jgi:pilus assembly protein CpaE
MAQPIRTLLAVEDGLDVDDLVALVSGDDSIRLDTVVAGLTRAATELDTPALDLVVVACRGYSDRALLLIAQVVGLDPDRIVIVISDNAPPGFVGRVFEAGAEDILPLPQSRDQVHFAIHKTFQRKAGSAASHRSDFARLVAVLGPKGGTGKTLTACNVAVAMAERGLRTVLIDLDLQFGDVGLTLGLSPERTIYDLAISGGTVDADKVSAYLVPHISGLESLLAPNRPDHASAVTPQLVREIYGALRDRFEFIVVDTPPGFTPEVITTIDASTDLVMVGMLDSLSLKNTKLGLETLDLMGYESDNIRLVLNRAHSRVGISQADVVAVLGREPDILVPSDREIPRAVNEGVPIVRALPDSEAAKAFVALASLFAGAPTTQTAIPMEQERQPGLFGRLAGRKA